MPDYNVNRPVKLDGKIHKPGCKPVTVDAEMAQPAVESGALTEVVTEAPPKMDLPPQVGTAAEGAGETGEQSDGQTEKPAEPQGKAAAKNATAKKTTAKK